MIELFKSLNKFNLVTTLGILTVGLGLLVMLAWLAGNVTLVQIHPQFASMKFNTALCFFITGIAIYSSFSGHLRLIRGAGVLIGIIALLSLAQWLADVDLYLDNLFVEDNFFDPTAPPGRMSIPTAVCFFMSGLALNFYSFRHLNSGLVAAVSFLGGVVLAFGLVGLIDYVLSVYTDYGWQAFTVMAVHTSVGFLLVGTALVVMSISSASQYKLKLSAQMIPLLTVLVTLWLSLSIAQENKELTSNRLILDIQLDSQVLQIKGDIDFVISALSRGIARWEKQNGSIRQADWQADALLYVETLPYLTGLAWVGGSQHKLWFSTEHPSLNNDDLTDILFYLPAGRDNGFNLHTIRSPKLGNIIVMVASIAEGGYLLGIYDFAALLKKISAADEYQSTWLRFKLTDGTVFSTFEQAAPWHKSAIATRELTLNNLAFSAEAGYANEHPTPGLSVLSSPIFISGNVFIAVFLLAIVAYQRSRFLMKNLRIEKERFRLVIEAAPGAMLLVNTEGDIEFLNTKAETLFGYEHDYLLGKNVDELLPMHIRAKHAGLRQSFVQAPRFRSMAKGQELFGQHKNGQLIPLEIELCPIQSEQGLKVLASIFDLSERTKQIQILKKTNDELNRVGKIAKVGGWSLDLISRSLSWSPQTYLIHDVPNTQALTADFLLKFYADDDKVKLQQAMDNAIKHDKPWDLELPMTTMIGNKIWVHHQGQIEYQDGVAKRIVGAIKDISEHHATIVELERRNQELNNFAYVASHDLKSPLRGIDQLASWINEDLADTLSTQTKEHLRLMRSRINRMENLLNDLLTYSRVGRTEAVIECVNLVQLIENIFDFCNTSQHFELHISGVKGDYLLLRTPLELVLRNLINNAIKHHDKPRGTISIAISAKPNSLEFSVADDGPGIPPQHYERAFAMFQTLQPRDKVEGSGMGLAIVRKVIESFGGSIELSANHPRGALFRFSFPAKHNPE